WVDEFGGGGACFATSGDGAASAEEVGETGIPRKLRPTFASLLRRFSYHVDLRFGGWALAGASLRLLRALA
ncbi:MAG: hypothetical protein ACTS6P_01955, partial [Candidatus Hodgkinia cicadicola]